MHLITAMAHARSSADPALNVLLFILFTTYIINMAARKEEPGEVIPLTVSCYP